MGGRSSYRLSRLQAWRILPLLGSSDEQARLSQGSFCRRQLFAAVGEDIVRNQEMETNRVIPRAARPVCGSTMAQKRSNIAGIFAHIVPSHSVIVSTVLQIVFSLYQEVLRSKKLWCTLQNLLISIIGVIPKASASRDSESTSMGCYRDTEPENTRVAKHNDTNAEAETSPSWIVGTAEIHHMTGNRNLLSDFKPTEHERDQIRLQTCSGISMPVCGRGSVITERMVLGDVWYVPGLKRNVISVSQLANLDYRIEMNHGACYIRGATDDTIIGKAPATENGMFMLEFLKFPLVS